MCDCKLNPLDFMLGEKVEDKDLVEGETYMVGCEEVEDGFIGYYKAIYKDMDINDDLFDYHIVDPKFDVDKYEDGVIIVSVNEMPKVKVTNEDTNTTD